MFLRENIKSFDLPKFFFTIWICAVSVLSYQFFFSVTYQLQHGNPSHIIKRKLKLMV